MQNQVALSLKSNYALFSPCRRNPRLSPSVAKRNLCYYSDLKCGGIGIPVPKQRLNSLSIGNNASVEDERVKTVGVKDIDVATIGNLCVDVVLNVPKLPPKPLDELKAYMEELSKSPPDKVLTNAIIIIVVLCLTFIFIRLNFWLVFTCLFLICVHLLCLGNFGFWFLCI